jgi:uncharacterized membrane protein YhhN
MGLGAWPLKLRKQQACSSRRQRTLLLAATALQRLAHRMRRWTLQLQVQLTAVAQVLRRQARRTLLLP